MTNRLIYNLVYLQEVILAEAAQSALSLEQVQTGRGLVLTTQCKVNNVGDGDRAAMMRMTGGDA